MKINARLLLLTFIIVVLISVSSAIAYFSLTNKVITNQNNQSVLNSTNDFIFGFQRLVEDIAVDFRQIINKTDDISSVDLNTTRLDFIFTLKNETDIDFTNFSATKRLNIKNSFLSVNQFLKDNPNVILKYETVNNEVYYFGKVITKEILADISEKIRADVVLIVDGTPSEFSSEEGKQSFLPLILNAIKELKTKSRFSVFSSTYENSDVYAALYNPANLITAGSKIDFLILRSSIEAAEFRNTSGIIAAILIVSGIGLSLILVLLFTSKLRKQIIDLNYAVQVTGKGNLSYRVKSSSPDELGELGNAFNRMLDDLQKQKNIEKDYSEFITLINRNPSLKEIAEAALDKIIKSTQISFGVLYEVESNDILKPVASYGVEGNGDNPLSQKRISYYKKVIENRDIIELNFNENFPVVKTGLTEVKIKYVLIAPMIYAGEVVAIIELASERHPDKDVKSYILNIREQLAIGIINGAGFEKLSRLVDELKKLNDDYQNQNKELLDLHKTLEQKAEELNEQRVKALEATKLKSQFLANMTHELKTPLNSILGLSDLIENDDSISSTNRNRLKVIVRNSKRLLNLINNILEFSRAEAGKISVKKDQFSLSHFIDEIVTYIESVAEEKGLEFIVEYDENLSVLLKTDKGKLEQVIMNLLNNAVKFTETGYVKMKVSFPTDSDIKFDVIDTGIGISEENKSIVFEEFRQADGTTSRQYDGTGLGLSICKRFVDLLNGKMELESEVQRGSNFSVTLFGVVEEKVSQESSIINSEDDRHHILIVSPYSSAHKLYGDYFKLNNAVSLSAIDYHEAKELLREKYVNVILVNNILQDKPGWEFLYELKGSGIRYPIIIMTLDEDNNYGYALAVYNYIPYNFDREAVGNILHSLKEPVKDICSLSKDRDLNSFLGDGYNLRVIDKDHKNSDILFDLSENKPDLLFVDLMDNTNSSIELIDLIKHDGRTKSLEIVVRLPETLSREYIASLNSMMDEMLKKHKHHTLDILKILRRRLSFHENEKLRSRLLREDTPVDSGKVANGSDETINEDPEKLKVMVVDDDIDALFTVGEIIKNLGYEPIFAKNGVECLLTLNHSKPDLILLDIMMPKMDGFETIKEIKKIENRKDVPVVALTAYAMLDDIDIIQRNGFTDIITKPVNTAELSIKIRKVLGE